MTALTPATELAATNPARHPNESEEYRRARQELLVEEIELRRHAEQVAAQRRELPLGGELPARISIRGRERRRRDPGRPVRRSRHADRLQLHVRPGAGSTVPDVHVAHGRAGSQDRRHPPTRGDCLHRPLADRAPRRGQGGARLARSAGVQRRRLATSRGTTSRPTTPTSRRTTCSSVETARSVTSGVTRSPATWPIPARILAARSRWIRCGFCSTRPPRVAAPTGIPS